MKTKTKHVVLPCVVILFAVYTACVNQQPVFEQFDRINPWPDNYQDISAMKNYKEWGNYNVHDPSCLREGDTYYMYSTDAIYKQNRKEIKEDSLPFGYIQFRKSKDLVNWEFEGWAFREIPQEAKEWVLQESGGKGATNIWAPYLLKYKDIYRLYYCVSAFGLQTSYIGLAESSSPAGPWELKGCVVKTTKGALMNAIDPSIVTNPENGDQWMHYGSYFGGLYCVQLNPETGVPLIEDDKGKLTARRYDGRKNNIEAPEIIYNPDFNKYYLFVSYDPLMTTYNIRVGRSENPDGPFTDFSGKDMREETDNTPVLTYPYRFENHPGWAGTGHCAVFRDNNDVFYMAHQARLRPDNHQMVLHVRQLFWTSDGWPVASPERYAAIPQREIREKDIPGTWEVIRLEETVPERELFAGQIVNNETSLSKPEESTSVSVNFLPDKTLTGDYEGKWQYSSHILQLKAGQKSMEVFLHYGQDWENQKETILFTGLDENGCSVWGKKR